MSLIIFDSHYEFQEYFSKISLNVPFLKQTKYSITWSINQNQFKTFTFCFPNDFPHQIWSLSSLS